MNAPYKWIKEFAAVDATPHDFSRRMTMSGSKVEGYENPADEIINVVTGKILSIEKHPDSDHLQICQVDAGSKKLQIVTGAQNVSVGDVVPVALDGSTLPGGKKINTGKLRGVVSEGMMCSLGELGLTLNDFPGCIENGIMILPSDTPVGKNITEVTGLDDTLIEFEITSNRPDCLCVSGLGREAAATYGVPFVFPAPKARPCEGNVHQLLSVDIKAPELCSRYCAAILKNVKIAPSPLWMRVKLRGCGVRPINNIVDITNYVMLEYNQPMHAFDLANVSKAHINVRRAENGEKLTTLEGAEHPLTPDMLVIADDTKPIAVAGVMGGEYSGISAETGSVVFEAACFDGLNNRATSKALGLRTDSSVRFEKGLDPNNCMPALLRALELAEQIGAGTAESGIIDRRGDIKPQKSYPLEPERVNAFLGTEIPTADMVKYLEKLEFKVDGALNVTPPTFRGDIEGFADIAEEIARFFGYDKIPTTTLRGSSAARPTEQQRFLSSLRDLCVACGLNEISTGTFMNPRSYALLRIPEDSPLRNAVKISNPFGPETSLLRTTAVASMMEVLATNFKSRQPKAALFEIGSEFIAGKADELPLEPKKLLVGMYGGCDFYDLKGVVEKAVALCGVEGVQYRALTGDGMFHPTRAAELLAGGKRIGELGELHPEVAKNYGIRERVYIATVDADALYELRGAMRIYKGMPRFPALTRDLALVCDEELECAEIERVIRSGCGKLLENIEVFDVYRGEQLPAGKKSIAFGVTLRADDRTLTDAEADAAVAAILSQLSRAGITLRA